MKKDLYQEITDAIISELEKGIIPWHKPWTGTAGAISHATGKPYSLINQIMLGKPGEYLTWNQVQNEGGHVNKGAKAKTVVFWKFLYKDAETDELLNKPAEIKAAADAGHEIKRIPCLKSFSVFHIDDTTGIVPKYNKPVKDSGLEPVAEAENILSGYLTRSGVHFHAEVSDRAYYAPVLDSITVPCIKQYADVAEYYSTAFHECVHSTGHPSRLNRFEIGVKAAAFGSEDYSKEELVAEIGSACVLHSIGIASPASFKNSAAYVQNWLSALKGDKYMIVSAAGKAEKAVKLIMGEQVNESEQGAE